LTERQRILIIGGTGRHGECHRRTCQPCGCLDGRAFSFAYGDRVRSLWVKPRLPMDARWKQAADREADLDRLRRRGVWLEAASMVWTLTVAVAALGAGIVASSIALVGLGLDSAIELLTAAIVVWQLRRGRGTGEKRAAGLIAVTFLAGAAYLTAESTHELASHQQSAHSAAGLAISSAALVVLAVLALAKRRVGQALGSVTLRADAAETGLSAAAAAAALLGTGLDDWFGWWWTVPAAGLAIAALAIMEGIHTWRHRGS
jgi:divalent metal cation (Fe/Co/Zn/Cd) transporter